MNISNQIMSIENRLSRLRLIQHPPTLRLLMVDAGEQLPEDFSEWDLPIRIEPKR